MATHAPIRPIAWVVGVEMTTEPQRSQYLEAMGFTAWVSRYRLPNAAPTPACEWLEPDVVPTQPPAQRLHALLDAAEYASPSSTTREPAPASQAPASFLPGRQGAGQPKRARALLAVEGIVAEPDTNDASDAAVVSDSAPIMERDAASAPAVSLRFT
ncbi:MAG TPA: hypothetical protein VFM75_08455, partial [Modicisalibacter sp.]|nr:hypothetical protein [Modicisalibacter sp.]